MLKAWMIALVLTVCGCAATAPPNADPARKPSSLSLSPASLGRSLSLSQIVIGEYGDRTYKMRFEVEVTSRRLAIAALSPLGITLFTLVQDQGERAVVTRSAELGSLDPHHILFDLYLTYWPHQVLQNALLPLGMQLDQTGDGLARRIRGQTGELIAVVTYPPETAKSREIVIQHFDFPYRIRIVPLTPAGK